VINLYTKFKVSMINCNEGMKWGHMGSAQDTSMARWKAPCRLSISDNWTYFASPYDWGAINRYLSKLAFSKGVGHFESKF